MRKLVFLVLLSGCATEPPRPTAAQLAAWSYFAAQCGHSGSGDIVQALRADAALRGCVTMKAAQADAAVRRPNVLEEAGNALTPRQQSCATRPDYAGGWITSCY
jgi:hypothetical protein